MMPGQSRTLVWGDNERDAYGEKLSIWEQNGRLVTERKTKRKEAASD